MNPHELEVLLRLEVSANRTLNSLMDRIFNDEQPDEAVAALKQLAVQMPPENNHPLNALGFYRGMRLALKEGLPKDARTHQGLQYRRYRELFEWEIAITRKQKRSAMALTANWSGIESDLWEDLAAWRFRLTLRAVGAMFRLGVPGALDLCDSAVLGMFRTLYLRTLA